MTPKSDGTYKIPKEVVDAWKGGEQDRITQDFVDAGFDKEPNTKVSINIPPIVMSKKYTPKKVFLGLVAVVNYPQIEAKTPLGMVSFVFSWFVCIGTFGTNPHEDNFVTRSLKRLREKTSEQEMWVDGEFVSETDMRDRLKLSELLGCGMVKLSYM